MSELDSAQRDIYERLLSKSPALAELYLAAVRLVPDSTFPGRLRLLSHAVREIRNRLPDVFAGPIGSGGRIDTNFLDELCRKWDRHGVRLETLDPNTIPEVTAPAVAVPRSLAKMIQQLVERHKASREKKPEAARRLFAACAEDPGASFPATVDQWIEVTDWFMDQTHESNEERAVASDADIARMFAVFQAMLGALLREFFASARELDAILEDANS